MRGLLRTRVPSVPVSVSLNTDSWRNPLRNPKEETLYATLFGIAAGILALLACCVCYMASKERKGEALFAPKPASNPMRDDLEKA